MQAQVYTAMDSSRADPPYSRAATRRPTTPKRPPLTLTADAAPVSEALGALEEREPELPEPEPEPELEDPLFDEGVAFG